MRVLVVDDSSSIRTLLAHMFSGHGFHVEEAANGADALQKLLDRPIPDLITLDWNMPIMNGSETLDAIRQIPAFKHVPILVISSDTEQSTVMAALKGGADEYLMKPFNSEGFYSKIDYMLHSEFSVQAA